MLRSLYEQTVNETERYTASPARRKLKPGGAGRGGRPGAL